MLSVLHIENIAVIESADIVFNAGFNALTGETGAGKSIVVDAMSAVTGERTSRELIRTGAKSALVAGTFTVGQRLSTALAESGIAPDKNGELLLQREIMLDGKNVCRVNGRPVTVAQLKTLGRQLLNIHGQHDGQQLLDEGCHLEYLDRFGGMEAPLADYRKAYAVLTGLDKKISSLRMNESEKARRVDTLQFQIRELERAELSAGEEEVLNERRDILRNAADLSQAAQTAHFALSGDEDSAGAVALLMEAERALESVTGVSPELDELRERLVDCRCQAQDVADSARNLAGGFDFEPGELDQLESRLDLLYRLKKKYGNSVEEMLDYLERCRKELDEIQFADDTLARLEQNREKARKEAEKLAQILSEKRKIAGKALEERIQRELAQLDMPKVRFRVEFGTLTGESSLNEEGMDVVRFLMSANVGEDLKPIQKIASGGELARIMLALKNVLAENDDVGTLVFDEVDTGVSGRAAQKVAEKLAQVARHKQVLCVTHLPQLAAMADVHFSVEKGEREGRTFTAVEVLDRSRRQGELARLTSGDHITQSALDSAGELLDEAIAYKQTLNG